MADPCERPLLTLNEVERLINIAERIAALEARTTANEKAATRAETVAEKSMERSDTVLTKRFEAANEVREAMRDQTKQYVTRQEFQWAIGAVVLVLVGMLLKLLTG